MPRRKFYRQSFADRYTFSLGNRVVAVHELDSSAREVEESLGVEITLRRDGASVTGSLDRLERFAAILDVTHTHDDLDAVYRRASIADAAALLGFIARERRR